MKKAVAYLRVSKKDENIENQRIAIKKFSNENGYKIVEWFEEIGVSGYTVPVLKRKKFKEMLDYTEKTGIKRIIFFDFSRFGRSWRDTLATYLYLEDEGYELIFTLQPHLKREAFNNISETIDKPLGPLLADITFYKMLVDTAFIPNFESAMTGVRTRKGLERARAEGKKLGRPKLPEKVRETIIQLYEKGYTYEKIREFILENKIYLAKDGTPRAPSLSTISDVIALHLKQDKIYGGVEK